MDGATQYLSRFSFWEHLSPDEKAFAEKHTYLKNSPAGAVIYGRGDSCLGMTVVERGRIRVCLISEEGREITLYRVESGEACIMTASCVMRQITFETYMEAEGDCTLAVLDAAALKQLSESNIYLRCFIYELTAERFSLVMWSMQQLLFLRFDKRLAAFLLSEYERTSSAELRLTHEQIAAQINSAREVVTRMLKRFVSDGLCELSRGGVKLTDISGLRELL